MTRPKLCVMAAAAVCGCAALTNPVADGIPVRRVPAEVLGRPKTDLIPTPLTLLRQPEPEEYVLGPGDVLAVVADLVVNGEFQPPPVQLPSDRNPLGSVGFPFPVREDGTISLPRLPPIPVGGKTLREAEQLVKDYASGKLGGVRLVQPGATRISVQLLQRRTYEVLVIRENQGGDQFNQGGQFGGGQLGTDRRRGGRTVRLPAYENDVLRALVATGGLPGFDGKNEVLVIRGQYDPADPTAGTTRIPLRVYPDEPLRLSEQDVVLGNGDIVAIESRESEVFYTAGLLGGGQFLLPRDYDLRVVEAVAQIRGPLFNGGFNQNAFVAQSVGTGIGSPNPTLVTVVRRLPGGQQLSIRVNLSVAARDPRENIIVRPGDLVVLQERPGEALSRYFTQRFVLGASVAAIRQNTINGVLTTSIP